MSRFIKVEVTRSSSSEVYLEVPDDWVPETWPDRETLRKACAATVNENEWDPDREGHSIEAQSLEEIGEKEARLFETFRVEVSNG